MVVIQHRKLQRAAGPRQALAFTLTLLGHVGLGTALWFWVTPIARPKPPDVFYITVDPLLPKPPPEPVKPDVKPPETPQVAEAPKPVERPRRPTPAPRPAVPPADNGPPVHYFLPGAGAGSSGVASGLGAGNDGTGHHAVSDYADKVKARILANRTFPVPLQMRGLECVVTYSVTVDRSGQMIAHHIDPCPYAELNALAEAAIQKSGPFEPPENGAAQRVIYGSMPFHLEIQRPAGQARR